MAIRKRTGRAKPWECYWRNPATGKIESESFATKQEAEKKNSLIKHQLKFERESFQSEDSDTKIGEITLEQAYVAYLYEKQFNKRVLSNQISNMRPILRDYGDMDIVKIDRELLENILKDMRDNGMKSATIHTVIGRLFTLLRWCSSKGYCDPVQLPKLPSPDYERFIPPTARELDAIIEAAPPHIQRVAIIGTQLGARVGPSELFGLTWQDVDFTQGIIRIHGAKKNRKAPWREVPIRENLVPLMAQWAMEDKSNGISHIIHYAGKPVCCIKKAWSNTLKKAGISRRIRPYDLRHAFATELIAGGADIGTVAKLMGHSSPTMILEHYQYVMDKQKRAAVECLPEMPCMAKLYGQTKKAAVEYPQPPEIYGALDQD